MPERVNILRQATIFKKLIFRIDEVELRHERFDGGMSKPVVRLSLERGTGVGAVVHDTDADTILLAEQFRYPTYAAGGSGWLLEIPAGIVEAGENPADTLRREIVEEIGYAVDELEFISTFYVSPGGSTEVMHLYYATVSGGQRTGDGGGLDDEGEDIRRVAMPAGKIADRIADGTIRDARTLVGLQWFLLHKWA